MKDRIMDLVRGYIDDLPNDTNINLIETGLLDSLSMLSIMSSLESEFDIEIDSNDISKENFKSIDSMKTLVQRYIKQQ